MPEIVGAPLLEPIEVRSHSLPADPGLNDGDEYVENAIAVSFVEDTGWWDESMRDFMASWPEGLLDEAKRQRDASS